MTESERITALCAETLRGNWREGTRRGDGVPYGYTEPSPGHYPWQFYWDSCFCAIAWARLGERDRARRELASLLAAQRPDGFIGHTIFWDHPVPRLRRLTYNVTEPDAAMTASIQPPALAWAWRLALGEDPAGEPRIAAHHAWLERHRTLHEDGLLWIVQPDESGLDASPQFDPIWGRRAHGLAAFPWLVRRNRARGYDLRTIDADGGPVCCEPTTNVLYGLSRRALGLPSITPALVDRCWDERRGLFLPSVRPHVPPERIPATVAALTPLALPDLPVAIAERLVDEHLLDPARFWTPTAPPSVALGEPSFSLRDTGSLHQKRYWRGPTWLNAAWLCWLGLVRLRRDDAAAELGRRAARAVAVAGLREYYDPFSGAGMGAVRFAWSALVLELMRTDFDALRAA